MTLAAELTLILEVLGNSADDVANVLKAQRIKGLRNTTRFMNPICRYIEESLSLGPLSVDLPRKDMVQLALSDGTKLQAPLRPSIIQFLEAFNRGAYPEIEMPSEK
jgi:hypothetical protein